MSQGAGIRLATVDGRPVVRVEVVEDARATLAVLNADVAASTGRSTPAARSRTLAPAWREHRIVGRVAGWAPGVAVRNGRVVVELPLGIELVAFRRELSARLEPSAMTIAFDAIVASERLGTAFGGADHRGAPHRRVGTRDAPRSHLLDLGREPWLLYWIAVAALLAAIAAEAS